jgi:hypothetical protein
MNVSLSATCGMREHADGGKVPDLRQTDCLFFPADAFARSLGVLRPLSEEGAIRMIQDLRS